MEKIREQLQKGANFRMLAQEFSQSPSRSNGGDVGWITKGSLDQNLEKALEGLDPGQTTSPIRTPQGYYLLHLTQQKKAGEADPGETEVSFVQVIYPISNPPTEEEAQDIQGKLGELTYMGSTQSEVARIAKEQGARVEEIAKTKFNQLPEALMTLLFPLAVGDFCQPLMTPHGLMIAFLSDRKKGQYTPPSFKGVQQQLENIKLNKFATRDIIILKSQAYINPPIAQAS